jgi:hypothetical protein
MVPVHKPLHQQASGALRRIEGALDLFRTSVERLLADDVLSGVESAYGGLDVQRVRQRDVDGLDVRICEQLVVAPYARSMPCSRAKSSARCRSRLATASTSARSLCRIPANTASLIRAVERMPQRTGSIGA